jgi:hypothetical protein
MIATLRVKANAPKHAPMIAQLYAKAPVNKGVLLIVPELVLVHALVALVVAKELVQVAPELVLVVEVIVLEHVQKHAQMIVKPIVLEHVLGRVLEHAMLLVKVQIIN